MIFYTSDSFTCTKNMAMISSEKVYIICTTLLHLMFFLIEQEYYALMKSSSTANFPWWFMIILKVFESCIFIENMTMVSSKIAGIICTILLHLLAFLIELEQSVLSKSSRIANFPWRFIIVLQLLMSFFTSENITFIHLEFIVNLSARWHHPY